MGKKIKVQDIADALGISRNTVSKVLNGKYVPERTRIAVIKKAEELNYKSMGNINEEKNYSILLLSGKPLSNIDYYLPIIKTIENNCFQKNYGLLSVTLNMSSSISEQLDSIINSFHPDGIICVEIFDNNIVNTIIKLKLPTCFIDFPSNNVKADDNYDIIIPDTYDYGREIRDAIKKYGIKDISFIGDFRHCLTFKKRYLELKMAMFYSGLDAARDIDIVDKDDYNYSDPVKLKDRISEKANNSQIFVCANDYIARQTITALKLLKKKIPEEVKVIGFDGSFDALHASPTITTADVDKEAYGQMVFNALINRIKDPMLKTTLIEFRVKATKGETL